MVTSWGGAGRPVGSRVVKRRRARRALVRLVDWLVDVVIAWECRPGCRCDVCVLEHDGISW